MTEVNLDNLAELFKNIKLKLLTMASNYQLLDSISQYEENQ